jgi:hypothetical protein
MKGKGLLSVADLSGEDIWLLISDAIDMKAQGWLSILSGKTLAIISRQAIGILGWLPVLCQESFACPVFFRYQS